MTPSGPGPLSGFSRLGGSVGLSPLCGGKAAGLNGTYLLASSFCTLLHATKEKEIRPHERCPSCLFRFARASSACSRSPSLPQIIGRSSHRRLADIRSRRDPVLVARWGPTTTTARSHLACPRCLVIARSAAYFLQQNNSNHVARTRPRLHSGIHHQAGPRCECTDMCTSTLRE